MENLDILQPLDCTDLKPILLFSAYKADDKKLYDFLIDKTKILYNTSWFYIDKENPDKRYHSQVQYLAFTVTYQTTNVSELEAKFKGIKNLYDTLNLLVQDDLVGGLLGLGVLPLSGSIEDEELGNVLVHSHTGSEALLTPFPRKPKDWRADLNKIKRRDMYYMYVAPSLSLLKKLEKEEGNYGGETVRNFYNSFLNECQAWKEGELPSYSIDL